MVNFDNTSFRAEILNTRFLRIIGSWVNGGLLMVVEDDGGGRIYRNNYHFLSPLQDVDLLVEKNEFYTICDDSDKKEVQINEKQFVKIPRIFTMI